jgi:hypothetical protein
MKLGSMGVLATAVVVILDAGEARAQDQPCVPPDDSLSSYDPPPPPPRRPHAPPHYAAVYPEYVGERPPQRERGIPVEITPTAGYAFTSGVDVPTGSLALAPSAVFGATVDVAYLLGVRLEAVYMLQNSTLQFVSNGSSGNEPPQYDVTAHHFRVGGEYDILHGRVRPFVGLTMGVEWLAPQSSTPDELWFEASVEAGAKVRLTKALGIRAQAEVTGVAMDARSQVFCSSGCSPAWYGIATTHLALMAGPTLGF